MDELRNKPLSRADRLALVDLNTVISPFTGLGQGFMRDASISALVQGLQNAAGYEKTGGKDTHLYNLYVNLLPGRGDETTLKAAWKQMVDISAELGGNLDKALEVVHYVYEQQALGRDADEAMCEALSAVLVGRKPGPLPADLASSPGSDAGIERGAGGTLRIKGLAIPVREAPTASPAAVPPPMVDHLPSESI